MGNVIFFHDFENDLMNKDHIYDRLMEKSEEFPLSRNVCYMTI